MRMHTIQRMGWALVLLGVGVVGVAFLASTRPSERPSPGDPPRTAGGADVFARGGLATLPTVPKGAWTVHPGIHEASDVAPAGDGWAVLDARSRQVHFLGPDLQVVRTLGGPGEGPGELSAPVALAMSDENLLGVVDLTGSTVDLFETGGAFVDRLRPRPRPCPSAGIVRNLVPHPAGGFVLDMDCTGMTAREWVAARVDVRGEVARLAVDPLEDPARAVLMGGRGVVVRNGRLWLVTPDGCMRAVEGVDPRPGNDTSRNAVRCLPSAVPVPIPDSLREELRAVVRPGEGRPELELPSHFPPVLAVDWSPVGPVFRTVDGAGSGIFAILPRDGALRRVEGVGRAHAGRNGLLLVRTFMEGTGFHAVSWSTLFGPGGLPVNGRGRPAEGSGAEPATVSDANP